MYLLVGTAVVPSQQAATCTAVLEYIRRAARAQNGEHAMGGVGIPLSHSSLIKPANDGGSQLAGRPATAPPPHSNMALLACAVSTLVSAAPIQQSWSVASKVCTAASPCITLNNGVDMPVLAAGTWQCE